jgi:hypothetical protein
LSSHVRRLFARGKSRVDVVECGFVSGESVSGDAEVAAKYGLTAKSKGDNFREGNLHYAANGKVYDDSKKGAGKVVKVFNDLKDSKTIYQIAQNILQSQQPKPQEKGGDRSHICTSGVLYPKDNLIPDAIELSASYDIPITNNSLTPYLTLSGSYISTKTDGSGFIFSGGYGSGVNAGGLSMAMVGYYSRDSSKNIQFSDFSGSQTNNSVSMPLGELGIPLNLNLLRNEGATYYGNGVGFSKLGLPAVTRSTTYTPEVLMFKISK